MELFTFLGKLLDKAEYSDDCFDYDTTEDYTSLTYHREDIEPFAKGILDVYDPVKSNNYSLITVVFNRFNNCKIEELIFGNEKHDVKDLINEMVNDDELESIYISMCNKIVYSA